MAAPAATVIMVGVWMSKIRVDVRRSLTDLREPRHQLFRGALQNRASIRATVPSLSTKANELMRFLPSVGNAPDSRGELGTGAEVTETSWHGAAP